MPRKSHREKSKFIYEKYPNPANNKISFVFNTIDLNLTLAEVNIYDMSGRKVTGITGTINDKKIDLDLHQISPGTYSFHLITTFDLFNGKIIIVR